MKNSLLALNAVLLVAVGVLYYLHFSSSKPKVQTSMSNLSSGAGNSFKIAYFEMDSIENNYEYFKEVRNQLRQKEQKEASDLEQIKNLYAKKFQDYNQKAAGMQPAERQAAEQELMKLEETYKNKQQMAGDEMQNESFRKLQEIKKKIEDFLKEYNKDKGYSYIFASSPEIMYFRDSAYNITTDVLKGLNAMHKKK